jgi:hypothetical protein
MLALSIFGNRMSMSRLALATLLFAGASVAAPAAKAAVLSIPVVAFSQFCDPACSMNPPTLDNGVLKPMAFTTVYAPVDFPTNGERICFLTLIYQDINAGDAMTATLFRKAFAVGSNPFNPPVVIGAVSSAAGVVNTVRKATTKINPPALINENAGFYFVKVLFPTINLNLLGVQIDYRPTCPA